MSTLQLWAIGIDEVRGIFSAEPENADRLRTAATQRFGASAIPQPGLLGKLGPLLRGNHDPAAPRPGAPSPQDIEDLLAGHFVPPDRLVPAWNLLEFWIEHLALSSARWQLSEAGLNELDFALAKAQVPSWYGLSDLFKANLGISLTRCAGLADGFVRGEHARAMATAWASGLAELDPSQQELAGAIIEFLSGFTEWASEARTAGHPEPDLVAIFRSTD
jgi:hypothetical protein